MSGADGRDPATSADGLWARQRVWPAAPAEGDTPAGRRFVRGVHAVAGAVAVLAVGWTAWRGVAQPQVALAWGALIALGEATWRAHPGGQAETPPLAPVGAAGALAYALLGGIGGREATHGVPQVVAVVFAATLVGAVGRPPALDELARRVLTTAFVAGCFQPPHHAGALDRWPGHGPYYVIYLLSLLVLSTLGDALLAAALARARTGGRYGRALRTELRAVEGPGTAIHATGAVIAPAVGAAGLWALPALGLPLLFVQLGARRPEAARAAVRHQTVAALARAAEIAGHVPTGRSHRVAALGRAVGRELGLSAAELDAVEHAALLRDVGRLALPDAAPPAELRRAALLAAAVARRAGVPAAVAEAVERQGEPYRAQPLAARIVTTVRAYDTYTTCAGHPHYDDPTGDQACGPLRALERLRLATAHDHEPRVVEALARVLSRCAPAPAGLR